MARETVLLYADNYGSRSLDIEVAVELHGTRRDIIRAKKVMQKEFLAFFKADREYKRPPKEKLKWHMATADTGKSRKRGFSGLDVRTRYGKSIDDFREKLEQRLREYYRRRK